MLVVTAFSHKDQKQAVNLFNWIHELDESLPEHELLLVGSNGMKKAQFKEVFRAAKQTFSKVETIEPVRPDERGWPQSCNTLFRTAAKYVSEQKKCAFWWNEPDCIPLRSGWLDELEWEYRACGKPFMGCIYDKPFPHLTGCAIYPAKISQYNAHMLTEDKRAWDVASPFKTIPHTHHTLLFQHEWGNFQTNTPIAFPTLKSLEIIRPEACVFHRSKSGDLIARLRDKRAGKSELKVFVERVFK